MTGSRFLTHASTLAWALFVALLLLLPADAYDPGGAGWLDRLLDAIPLLDKTIHAALFGVQAFLLRRSLDQLGASRPTLWAAVLAALYGGSMELLQGPIPGRATGVTDMIANIVGAVLGAIMPGIRGRSSSSGESGERASDPPARDRSIGEGES